MLNHFVRMIVLSIREPAKGAKWVLEGGIPRSETWAFFLLACALSGFVAQLGLLVNPIEPIEGAIMPNGFMMGFMVAGSILILTGAVTWIGRVFGGTGTLADVFLLITWIQFVMIGLQVVQTALGLVAQPLSVVLAWLGLGLMLWLLTHFVTYVHGFRSPAQVFIGIIGSAIGLSIGLSVLLVMLGLFVPQGG